MSNTYTLRMFSSTWCQQCPGTYEKLEKLAAKYPEITLEKVVTDAPEPGQVVPLDITSVPSLDLYKGDEYLGRLIKDAVRPATIENYLELV